MKYVQLATLFLSLLTATTGRATSIAIIMGDKQIVVASDSMCTYATPGHQSTFQYCKIHAVGSLFFAVDGVARSDSDSLDAVKTATNILAQGGKFKASVERIAAELNRPLLLALQRAHRTMAADQYITFV